VADANVFALLCVRVFASLQSCAVVDIHATEFGRWCPLVAFFAHARVAAISVNAISVKPARVRPDDALVLVVVAFGTNIPRIAFALEVVDTEILAETVGLTTERPYTFSILFLAVIDVGAHLAGSRVSRVALARVTLWILAPLRVDARSVRRAAVLGPLSGVALVHVLVALRVGPASRAIAVVIAGAHVLTFGLVLTRGLMLVVTAVVNVNAPG